MRDYAASICASREEDFVDDYAEQGQTAAIMDTNIIPVLSLVVAALAVFVGPLVSLHIARRQTAITLGAANKGLVAPMRQAWINSLRNQLAGLSSSALHYFVAGFEERSDAEYRQLTLLEHKIQLMLNPKEEDHRKL